MVRGLNGRVAVVTGGGSGIGEAAALAFARYGAKVVVADVSEDGQTTTQSIAQSGGDAMFVKTDVSQPTQVEEMVHRAVEKYGRLDFAFNNAGIEGATAPTADCTLENWNRVIAVNLTGAWLCMKYEIPAMLARGGGAIVNMSSVAGLVGFNGLPAYCASKGGVAQLTKTAALEYADKGIRVNAVCPGAILTPMVDRIVTTDPNMGDALVSMHPIGRLGKPEEVAELVVWLCSDAASFVTGVPVPIDGGFVAR